MGKRPKTIAAPFVSDEDKARQQLALDQQRRQTRCADGIKLLLERERCTLVVTRTERNDGAAPSFSVETVALA